MKKIIIMTGLLAIAVGGFLFFKNEKTYAPSSPQAPENTQNPTVDPPKFDKAKHSIDDPASIWLIVNKNRPIPLNYKPANLSTPSVAKDTNDSADEQKVRADIASSVEDLFNAAIEQGQSIFFASGYRSSVLQASLYNGYVARDGQAEANKYSAKPGTSEHQTGLAFDIASTNRKCYLEICFSDTPEGKWLANNVHKYGFTLRYKKDKEKITGYQFEPWHFRYVGIDLARQLYDTDKTMEEFFEL